MSLDLAFFSFNPHQDLLVQGLKNAIKHVPGVDNFVLVWDDYVKQRPIDFDQVQRQVGRNIRVVLHSDLDPWPTPIARWGWIKQQLVKLRCFEYSSADYVWIVDGDVLITKDPELFRNGLPVLRYDQTQPKDAEKSQPHAFIKRYFGIDQFHPYTWIGSTCVFDNKICREIWAECLRRNQKSLTECVVETIEPFVNDQANNWPFSEFELYGNYCLTHHPDRIVIDEKNWNYAPVVPGPHVIPGLSHPIQIMWKNFQPDVIEKFLEP